MAGADAQPAFPRALPSTAPCTFSLLSKFALLSAARCVALCRTGSPLPVTRAPPHHLTEEEAKAEKTRPLATVREPASSRQDPTAEPGVGPSRAPAPSSSLSHQERPQLPQRLHPTQPIGAPSCLSVTASEPTAVPSCLVCGRRLLLTRTDSSGPGAGRGRTQAAGGGRHTIPHHRCPRWFGAKGGKVPAPCQHQPAAGSSRTKRQQRPLLPTVWGRS